MTLTASHPATLASSSILLTSLDHSASFLHRQLPLLSNFKDFDLVSILLIILRGQFELLEVLHLNCHCLNRLVLQLVLPLPELDFLPQFVQSHPAEPAPVHHLVALHYQEKALIHLTESLLINSATHRQL